MNGHEPEGERIMKLRNEKGFTLAEVMISAAILGVGVMGMAAMQGVSFRRTWMPTTCRSSPMLPPT